MGDGDFAGCLEAVEEVRKVVIAWPGYTGYMGPCFKALAELCELRVYIEPSAYEQRFDSSSMEGVGFRRVDAERIASVEEEIRAFAPDLTLVCGWSTPLSRALARAKLPGRKALAFDMPWEWALRKLAARWVLWPHLRHFDAAFVPGKRCARYARWLGFRGSRLVEGSNPSGWERFKDVEPSARGFVYVGRRSPEKGLDVLEAAYARYRQMVVDPWPLELVGGETFVKPENVPAVLGRHACLILPSRWEPWGIAAAEAMCAGLATILSDACGIVSDVTPTRVVGSGDIEGLARAMAEVHRMSPAERKAAAAHARQEMARYSCAEWAERVLAMAWTEEPGCCVASLWEEHCLECAMPACWGTCPMFERGWHGRCVRADGFEESVLGTGTVRFRRWGKIELMYHGRMMSATAAARVGTVNRLCRGLWRLLGKYHRALRWRLVGLCGRRGVPNVWRLRMTGERDETLCAAIAYEDGREAFRAPLPLKAGEEKSFELALPAVEDGALFRIFPLNGEATGAIRIDENLVATSHQPLTTHIKCVAWDLDGVVWDGTLSEGEDVKLRPGVMEAIRALDEAGVVSSVCSKNDEDVAIAKLKELGVEEWFVFPQISWGPKSESIKKLAREMNIGLDAIAFVDDREENREDVRANCPGVLVLDERAVDGDWRLVVGHGKSGGLGRKRRLMYREEMVRRGAAKAFGGDSAAFAEASGLKFELLPVEGERVVRCRELVQRTNQLNLTARRYDEEEFSKLLASTTCHAVRVWDKYGDYGIVGFLSLRGTHVVECCFSCRAAGRGVERKVLAAVANGRRLTADIVETERNAPIRKIIKEFV